MNLWGKKVVSPSYSSAILGSPLEVRSLKSWCCQILAASVGSREDSFLASCRNFWWFQAVLHILWLVAASLETSVFALKAFNWLGEIHCVIRASPMAQLVKNPPAMQETGFNPWVRKIPQRRDSPPTPVFWPGEFHGVYKPWSRKELDMTEWLSLSLC